MFSGIVEKMAQVVKIEQEETNKHFTFRSPFAEGLGIDQSIAHNGVCLTVVHSAKCIVHSEEVHSAKCIVHSEEVHSAECKVHSEEVHSAECKVHSEEVECYTVTAMEETLKRTNLDLLKEGDWVNVERAMTIDKLLDGHIVQGHVDQTATCIEARETEGSWYYRFEYESSQEMIRRGYFCVDKGSVAINGVSLTVCEPDVQGDKGYVSVCIIPYTHEETNFKYIEVGSVVNLEFDIIGKYLSRMMELHHA